MKALYMYSEKEAENTGALMRYFNDNGLPCDGSLLSVEYDDEDARSLEEAGLGAVLDAMVATDDAMAKVLHMAPAVQGEELDQDTIDNMKAAADEYTAIWAHYGAYGSNDSTWIFVPLAELAG